MAWFRFGVRGHIGFNLAIEMLIISGNTGVYPSVAALTCFNLAIEMLIISGSLQELRCHHVVDVSISQSRCLSFQAENIAEQEIRFYQVSISQSRCLSFQATARRSLRRITSGFNLAIEMLIISGCESCCPSCNRWCNVSISQSRCLSFQDRAASRGWVHRLRFQSRNRDAYHFRRYSLTVRRDS